MPPVEAGDEKAGQAGESRQLGERHDEGDGPVGDARRDQNVVEADGAQDSQHDKSQQSQQQLPVIAPDPPLDIGRNVDLNAVVFADHRCEPKGSGPVVTGGNELSRTLRSNFCPYPEFSFPAERAENCSHIEPADTLLCLRIADAQIQNSVLLHPKHGFLRRFESVPHVLAAITKLTFRHLTILSQRLLPGIGG